VPGWGGRASRRAACEAMPGLSGSFALPGGSFALPERLCSCENPFSHAFGGESVPRNAGWESHGRGAEKGFSAQHHG